MRSSELVRGLNADLDRIAARLDARSGAEAADLEAALLEARTHQKRADAAEARQEAAARELEGARDDAAQRADSLAEKLKGAEAEIEALRRARGDAEAKLNVFRKERREMRPLLEELAGKPEGEA